MKRIRLLIICLGLLGIVACAAIYSCSGWSRINCWTHEINIATGHTRYTRYWFWRVTERRISQTWISDSLDYSATLAESSPDWRLVLTLSPGSGHSPHYFFHSALHDIRQAETTLEMIDATPAVRAKLATTILWLWKHFDHDHQAGDFLGEVLFSNRNLTRGRITETDIPSVHDWLVATRARLDLSNENPAYLETLDRAIASPSP